MTIPEYEAYRQADERLRRRLWIALWAMAVLFYVIFTWAMVGPALAHITATGVVYPPACCHSAATHVNGDCAPISSDAVVARADGYHVTLKPGQHPKLLTKGYSAVIPYTLARQLPEDDGQFHICLSTDGQVRYCFFAPGQGS